MRSVWAVANNTIKQALRMKVAVVFIVLLLVLLPVLGASVTGDGTLMGRLQTFISYGLSLMSILLCLFVIIISVYSIASDIQEKQICTVLTKPVYRFQLLLGKLLGVVLLSVGLLILFSLIIYSITIYMPYFFGSSEAELTQAKNEFYTARKSLVPPVVDVSEEVRRVYEKLTEGRQIPENVSQKEIIAELTNQLRLQRQAVGIGREIVWEFDDIVTIDPNASLFIRFKYDVAVSPPDSHIVGNWFVGDYRREKFGTKQTTPEYNFDKRRDPIQTFREIEVPVDAVAEDGYLAVKFENRPENNTTVIFPLEDGLEVLYKADTFTHNFIKAVLLIMFRLIFLACLGVLAASFLSFPVAVLFCLVIFFTAILSGFVLESFDSLSGNLTNVYYYTIRPVILLLPQFDTFNPTKFLVPARLLSWTLIARVVVFMVVIKSVLIMLLSLLIFSYKEIAKVTV